MIDADRFSADPGVCFAGQADLLHRVPRVTLEALQTQAIADRFRTLAPRLPVLSILADAAGIRDVAQIEDAAPLLFPHGFYKSYDDYWLDYGCYNDLTDWIAGLSAVDLSGVRNRDFATLDDWIDTLERDAGLIVAHSSGTTGRLSFLARSTEEVEANARYARLTVPDWSGLARDRSEAAQFAVLWASFARGRSAVGRGAHAFRHGYAASEADFVPLIPGALSADWHYFMMRLNRAEAIAAAPPVASAYVAARIEEMAALRNASAAQIEAMLDRVAGDLAGRRTLVAGAPFVLHDIAKAGARRGLESAFGPDSAVIAFGGLKGRAVEDRMAETILRFSGATTIANFYVMTEASAALTGCERGYFHLVPWVVPFLLDPATGQLLPRDGARTGRAAFFDLLGQSYWGGIVTADRITLDWTSCPCGRESARIHPDIARFDDGEGPPPCAASQATLAEAMRMLHGS